MSVDQFATPPAEVVHKLFRDYCMGKYEYNGPYVSDAARERDIDNDAQLYREGGGSLLALVNAAYAAGHRDGADAVTELSVMHAAEAEIDKIWEQLADKSTRDAIGDVLQDRDFGRLLVDGDPWASREAADRVVAVLKKLLERTPGPWTAVA